MSLLLPVSRSYGEMVERRHLFLPHQSGSMLMVIVTDCCWRLQTAFHASFTDNATADKAVLQISRGTSIVGSRPALNAAQLLTSKRSYF